MDFVWMNSVHRTSTFFATTVILLVVFSPAGLQAQSGAAETQAQQTDSDESESSAESPNSDQETDQADEGDESDEPASQSSEQPEASETSESESMTPAGEGDIQSPAEANQPESASDTDEGEQSETPEASSGQPAQPGSTDAPSTTDSPISDLAESQSDNDQFEPVEDIEEEMLQEITPTKVYPYFEWDGFFRVRSDAMVNLDLDTDGTSAILPPAGSYRPSSDNAANSGNELLWSTNMNLRFDPTLHISERLSVHMEADLLDNVVLGTLSERRRSAYGSGFLPDPSRTVNATNDLAVPGSDVFRLNEAYGQVDFFLGTLQAGRMDFDWGLGTYANGGDCIDCDYGDHVDRIRFRTQPIFDFYTSAAIDFPSQGPTAGSTDGQPYDRAQIDDARQYTFSVFKKPVTKEDKEKQQKRLKSDQKPVFNGGALFQYRTQAGEFTTADGTTATERTLQYRGLNMYVPDVWVQMLYHPDSTTKVRLELEGTGVFGQIDTEPSQQTGTDQVNCFLDENEGAEECGKNNFSRLGGALESEFYFGGPVRFGLNAGYASGSDSANWGYNPDQPGSSLDFYRFDPNYHVDLILFREVIGSVTNAYYANPYVQARFFETPDRRLEVQFDTIVSRATNQMGTPSGESNWLGVELDGAVRYLQTETFQAGLEGGILFPLGGLDAIQGRRRFTQPGPEGEVPEEFANSNSASIGWTVQTNLTWMF